MPFSPVPGARAAARRPTTLLERAFADIPDPLRGYLLEPRSLVLDGVQAHLRSCPSARWARVSRRLVILEKPILSVLHGAYAHDCIEEGANVPRAAWKDLLHCALNPFLALPPTLDEVTVFDARDCRTAIDTPFFEVEVYDYLAGTTQSPFDEVFPGVLPALWSLSGDLEESVRQQVERDPERLVELLLTGSQVVNDNTTDIINTLWRDPQAASRTGRSSRRFSEDLKVVSRLADSYRTNGASVDLTEPRTVLVASGKDISRRSDLKESLCAEALTHLLSLVFGRPDGSLLLPNSLLLDVNLRSARNLLVVPAGASDEVLDTAVVLMRDGTHPDAALRMAIDLAAV